MEKSKIKTIKHNYNTFITSKSNTRRKGTVYYIKELKMDSKKTKEIN